MIDETGAEVRPQLDALPTGTFGGGVQLAFSAEAGNRYFAEARSILPQGFGQNERSYELTLTSLPGDEANDVTTTLVLADGESVSGSIVAAGDYDWIRLETAPGTSYEFQSTAASPFAGATTPVSLIRIDDATGEITDILDPVGRGAFTAEDATSYFLRPLPGVNTVGLYNVTLESFADDAPDNRTTDIELGVDTPATVTLQGGGLDTDFIRLDLAPDASYRITGDALFDIISDGQIGSNFGRAGFSGNYPDPRVDFSTLDIVEGGLVLAATFSPEADTDYFLVTRSSFSLDETVTFEAEVATTDTPDNASTGVSLTTNSSILGIFESPSDQDWIRIDIPAGESHVLRLANGPANDLLTLFTVDSDGRVRLLETLGLTVTVVTGREDETIYAQVGALKSTNRGGTILTTYTLNLTPLPEDEVTDERLPAVNIDPIAVDDVFRTGEAAAVSGALLVNDDPTDGPDLAVTGIAGQTVSVGSVTTLASGATVTTAAGGSFTYDPNDAFNSLGAGEVGEDSFTYIVSDGLGGSDQATARITIDGSDEVVDPEDPEPPLPPTSPTSSADLLVGTALNDTINALGGNDTLLGQGGGDSLSGGGGADQISGGAGRDLLLGNGGRDLLQGNGGADSLEGGGGRDVLEGGGGRDLLRGGGGRDLQQGGGGKDTLDGEGGKDTLEGGGGRDDILGGRGSDVLTGGAGRDNFIFDRGNGRDRITDFQQNRDKIVVEGGAEDFAALTITQVGDDVLIRIANTQVTVEDDLVIAFTASDFVF